MFYVKEKRIKSTGDKDVDDKLAGIRKKINGGKKFNQSDLLFVVTLLKEKINCEICQSVSCSMYLYLWRGRQDALASAEFNIVDLLIKRKEILKIPELQAIPTGEDSCY